MPFLLYQCNTLYEYVTIWLLKYGPLTSLTWNGQWLKYWNFNLYYWAIKTTKCFCSESMIKRQTHKIINFTVPEGVKIHQE